MNIYFLVKKGKSIAKACDLSVATLYLYFDNLDDLIVQSPNTV